MRPFPKVDGALADLSDGGHPRVGANGRELFFLDGNDLLTPEVELTPLSARAPAKVSPGRRFCSTRFRERRGTYPRVSRDGQRFLMIKDASPDRSDAPGRDRRRPELVRRAEAPRPDEVTLPGSLFLTVALKDYSCLVVAHS